jgi:KDEL-tailed cysteine endopeptidase
MDFAFDYIATHGGLASEESYPYTGTDDKCKRVPPVIGSWVKAHVDVSPHDKFLMESIAKQPVSVGIEADQPDFQLYAGGVFTGA